MGSLNLYICLLDSEMGLWYSVSDVWPLETPRRPLIFLNGWCSHLQYILGEHLFHIDMVLSVLGKDDRTVKQFLSIWGGEESEYYLGYRHCCWLGRISVPLARVEAFENFQQSKITFMFISGDNWILPLLHTELLWSFLILTWVQRRPAQEHCVEGII